MEFISMGILFSMNSLMVLLNNTFAKKQRTSDELKLKIRIRSRGKNKWKNRNFNCRHREKIFVVDHTVKKNAIKSLTGG